MIDDLKAYSDGGAHSGDDLYLYLLPGDYVVGPATGNKPFTYYSTASTGELHIGRGWTPDFGDLVYGAPNVAFDGNNIAQVLKIDNKWNAVSIFQIIVQNGQTDQLAGGLGVNTVVVGGGTVVIQNSNKLTINNTSLLLATSGQPAVIRMTQTHEVTQLPSAISGVRESRYLLRPCPNFTARVSTRERPSHTLSRCANQPSNGMPLTDKIIVSVSLRNGQTLSAPTSDPA